MILTINGVKRTVQEWSAISGTPVPTIQRRSQRGASDHDAVFRPVNQEQSQRMTELGRQGGTARAAALSPARRREISAHASHVQNGAPTLITYRGRTGTALEWERWCGIEASIIYARKMADWSDEDAVSIPPGGRRP